MKVMLGWSLPTALLGLVWLNMRTQINAGSESMTSVGFPFPWVAADFSSSMAYTLAWGPLMLDFCLWLLASHLVIAITMRKSDAKRTLAVLSVTLWLGAAVSVAHAAFSFSMAPRFVPWSLDSYFDPAASRARSFQFGPVPPAADETHP